MMGEHLIQSARAYLDTLCVEIPTRAVGSAGNQCATAWFAETIRAFGFTTEMPPFDCMDWSSDGAAIKVDGAVFHAQPSSYALGCDVHAPLLCISTVSELEHTAITGSIVLLHGKIARRSLLMRASSTKTHCPTTSIHSRVTRWHCERYVDVTLMA